jgi:acyl-coenzyme A synthetase/AMP-(fatty) acid ligase
MLVGELLESQSSKLGDKVFIIWENKYTSYSEFNKKVNMTANYLKSLGISRGTHVALLLPNNLGFLLFWFAIAKIGAVMVPINSSLKQDGIKYILEQSGSNFLFLDYQLKLEIDSKDLSASTVITQISQPLLMEIIGAYSEEFCISQDLKASDPMSIVYTSGTTSLPKGAVNSQTTYYEAGKEMANFLGLDQEDLMYIFLPLFHVNPQFYGVMSSLFNGNTILLDKKFSVNGFWENAAKYKFSVFTYVGTVLSILCKKTEPEQIVNSIKCCVGGGAPRLVWEEITKRFGIKVMELYGMTEIGGFTTGNSVKHWKFDSVGKPRDSMDIRIFNKNDEECDGGEIGEIVVRPKKPNVIFDGYYKQPEKTLESLSNLWFHTGDCGFFDEEGFMHYCGRIKEIIRRNGENISPFEIESTILKYPQIAETAVVGVPDEISEEEIKACIVLNENVSFSQEEFSNWLDKGLPSFMKPKYLEILQELPKTATEKIEKNKLIYLSENVSKIF